MHLLPENTSCAIIMPHYPGIQKRECPIHLCFNGKLNGWFDRVEVVMELLNLVLGQGCERIVHIAFPERWLATTGSQCYLFDIFYHEVDNRDGDG